ncbi:MAG: HAMP domain-containing histidine kinase [Eubacterium sp.]|nr:HAMP domain-containing histidine kinase [Eubacterium sp.]
MSGQYGEEDTKYNLRHLAGGCIASLLAVLLLQSEKRFIVRYLLAPKGLWLRVPVLICFDVCTVLVFFRCLRYFRSVKSRKLTVDFLLSILLSVVVAVITGVLTFLACERRFMESARAGFFDTDTGMFVLMNLYILFITGFALVFALVFACLVRGRVTYIQYISREIKTIEKDGFGRQLKVNGLDELTDLCTSINHMSQKLYEKQKREQELENRKNELIVNVSHDLRSPLTSIMGYVRLLKQEGASDPEKFQEYISVVDRRLEGLHAMVDELFELTKLNSADVEMNVEKTDLCALLCHLAYEHEILLKNRGLALEKHLAQESFEVQADVNKFVRAVQNLFDNAGKYAKEHSKIVITSYVKGDAFSIQMKNQVREQDCIQAEKLFERFYIADAARSQTKSSGLGLAIVKRIVELHGGKITAHLVDGWLVFKLCFYKQE